MNDELAFLRSRVHALERDNALLRAKVTFFDRAPWMRDGIRGEQIVADLIGGTTTAVNERFDVLTPSRKVRLEVKYSNLNTAMASAATKRWQWIRVFGFDGKKDYHSLILVGDADLRFQDFYRDPASPYVFFDIPFERLRELTRASSDMIQISTNPQTARTPAARFLFNTFQITPDELIARYRNG